MAKIKFSRFDVYWWVESDSPRLCRLATRSASDIHVFSPYHMHIHVRPLDAAVDGKEMDLILRSHKLKWTVKCPEFEDPEFEYPFAFSQTDAGAVWTDALDDELMVIQAHE